MNKISVIVPFYNADSTLDRCIKSILRQTYKDFELLLIDDGSCDDSREVAEKYTYIDRRVKYFLKENGGVSSARNYGMERAAGEFIQFIDADDYIEPEMLETLHTLITSENADVAICNHTHPCIANYIGTRTIDTTTKEGLLAFYQNTFAALLPWNKMWKRSVICEKFDESTGFCEDDLFCLSNMSGVRKIATTEKVLYNYYVAPYTSLDEASCIIKMAKAPDFWQTKNTFWYMRRKLLEASKKCLAKHRPADEIDDFAYIRIFDFVPVEIVLLGAWDVDEYGLTREMQNIFAEEDFHKSLQIKEKYGVHFTAYEPDGRDEKVAEFVHLSLRAVRDIRDNGKALKPFFVVLNLFAAMFTKASEAPDTLDFLAKAALDMRTLSTAEAKYAAELLCCTAKLAA
ncbi:MAG: glycosyltransferase family 2 protein [Clostridia bacterium]|nr:glycosyltransferase family 2 protein [Clostridia bacterium]